MVRRWLGILEAGQFRRGILAGAEHRPGDRRQQHHCAEVERIAHRIRHFTSDGRIGHAEVGQDERQEAGDNGADADEETLHRARNGSIDTLIEASSTHNVPAAIHSVGEFGITSSASVVSTAPIMKNGRRRPQRVQVRSDR
ncbi:hypothetical protein G6F35_017553 [Rhizopus arrhizus]|nr:hypothetical protein G6F35_017553 [Rhizopus arrhizus]